MMCREMLPSPAKDQDCRTGVFLIYFSFLGELQEGVFFVGKMIKNIFESLPTDYKSEIFDNLLRDKNIRIERIVSKGHTSPASGWYDQEENEWVLVLEGAGTILFADGRQVTLNKGDFLQISAHEKHKVAWTDPDRLTIWLAVHYLA